VVAIVTMTLAIGANTLLFSLASPLVVRALPIGDPDSLGWIRQTNGPRGISAGRTSLPDFLDFRESARSFSSMAALRHDDGRYLGHPQPAVVVFFVLLVACGSLARRSR